jgi:uncharacterized metal-binding protein
MPSGRIHEAAAAVVSPAVAVSAYQITSGDLPLSLVTWAFFLFGAYYLSPDLDVKSRPYLRWGSLKWYWWPYKMAVEHRNWVSHGPVISTIFRIFYLAPVWSLPTYWLLEVVGAALGPYLTASVFALIMADLLHIGLDSL